MDRFKKFLKQAIHEQAVRVKLQAGSPCELLLSTGVRHIDDGQPIDDDYIRGLFAALLPTDEEALRTKPMVKGALSVPNVGRIPMIAQPGSPSCLRLYLPPQGAQLFESDWKRLSAHGFPIIVDQRDSQVETAPPVGEVSPREEAQSVEPAGMEPIGPGFIPSTLAGSSTISPDLAVKPSWSTGESVDSGAAPKPVMPAFGAPLEHPVHEDDKASLAIPSGPPTEDPKPSIDAAHSIGPLLQDMVEAKASDLHLTVGEVPFLRVDGQLIRQEREPISLDAMESFLTQLTTLPQREAMAVSKTLDFVDEVADLGRFRCHWFRDYRGVSAVIRHIPKVIPTLEQLEMPEALTRWTTLRRGLILVTGPMGSGKSTTIAALIDRINHSRASHVVTLEGGLEFVHQPDRSLIHQRDVRAEGISMARALQQVRFEDPDVVVIGEMGDPETAVLALEIAASGCLVIGAMATAGVVASVEDLIEQVPAPSQGHLKSRLASLLKVVVSQTLVSKKEGGRALALETLIVSDNVASMIRDGKWATLSGHVQSQKGDGNQSLTEALLKLVKDGVVDADEALSHAVDRSLLAEQLRRANLKSEGSSGRLTSKSA